MAILLAPIVVVLLAVCAVVAAFRKSKVWFFIFLILCLGANWWSETFTLHPFSGSVSAEKEDGVLRVMTYNIWNGGPYMSAHKEDTAEELVHSLDSMDVDVLLLCELIHDINREFMDTMLTLYPYNTYVLADYRIYNPTLLFSRYPIKDFNSLKYCRENGDTINSESWLLTLQMPESEIKLSICHLASNKIDKVGEDDTYVAALREGYKKRAYEADALRDSLDMYNMPKLVMGDFNDIGGSYAVRQIKGNDMADAWWEGGFGFGFTYDMHHLLLRLDHILYSKCDFELCGVKVLNDWKYSDHYPIVADFKLND